VSGISAELAGRLSEWRKANLAIVFTNGVFDLLHFGHVRQLQAARALGDVLVVGLNSDTSARSLGKGGDRPLMPQAARQAVLEELRCVDAVAVFDEPTPLELIRIIQPDVLVKGEDYAEKEVVGREVVESRGGRVVLVPLEPGFSTTDIVTRIRRGG
jgi:D-beta-D-heptose 7-phosphate kinase/D-beta-D-heptose 1-phosphate adenosyltransferase